jgi:translation initiation factor 2 beta subunit (eIF-2beta)/eIF-5
MPYRLHIDIPLSMSEEDALRASQQILSIITNADSTSLNTIGVEEINYRLGHDDDRQKSNYFMKNENGHVNNKKSKILVSNDLTSD